jgi:hypothetical protein
MARWGVSHSGSHGERLCSTGALRARRVLRCVALLEGLRRGAADDAAIQVQNLARKLAASCSGPRRERRALNRAAREAHISLPRLDSSARASDDPLEMLAEAHEHRVRTRELLAQIEGARGSIWRKRVSGARLARSRAPRRRRCGRRTSRTALAGPEPPSGDPPPSKCARRSHRARGEAARRGTRRRT